MNASIQKRSFLCVFSTLLLFHANITHATSPLFSQYPVSNIYKGKNHRLLENDTGFFEIDWTRKQAIHEKPNFAGHYVVYTFNCGTGSMCGEVLDVKNGIVFTKIPHPYESESLKITTRQNSALMIISGIPLDQEDGSHTKNTEYFIIQEKGLKNITPHDKQSELD